MDMFGLEGEESRTERIGWSANPNIGMYLHMGRWVCTLT